MVSSRWHTWIQNPKRKSTACAAGIRLPATYGVNRRPTSSVADPKNSPLIEAAPADPIENSVAGAEVTAVLPLN
jgi:hypothetical protein